MANEHGTPLFVVDHDELRQNYATFKKYLPRVQAYYAVKANSDPAIVKTFYEAGASFDVASMAEFRLVYENIKSLPAKERQDFIWDKIIYANPIKDIETLVELDPYKPLVTYDNLAEIDKLKKYAPHAGLILRIRVPNTGAVVELSSKFGARPGEAVDLIEAAFEAGLTVEGLSFHVGSQMHEFRQLRAGAAIWRRTSSTKRTRAAIRRSRSSTSAAASRRRTTSTSGRSSELAETLNSEFDRLFPKEMEILAEPGRFLVASAATCVADGHRQSGPRRQAVLLHQRRRLSHLLGRDLRPHPLSDQGVQGRADQGLLGVRSDVRRARHDLAGRATARAGTRRFGLQPEHRRLHARFVDPLQRLSAGQGRARQSPAVGHERRTAKRPGWPPPPEDWHSAALVRGASSRLRRYVHGLAHRCEDGLE